MRLPADRTSNVRTCRRLVAAAPPLVRAVLVRPHVHQWRLHDAGGGGRLADLRSHQRSARSRPGRAGAVLSADRDLDPRRASPGYLRPAHGCRRLPDRQGARGARARDRHRARLARARSHVRHSVPGGDGARVRDSDHAFAAAGRGLNHAVAAGHRRVGVGAADRRHLRAVARRAALRVSGRRWSMRPAPSSSSRRAC